MIEIFLVLIFIFLVGFSFFLVFYFKKVIKELKEEKKEDTSLSLIQQNLFEMRRTFENGYGKIAEELGRVKEIGRQMKDFQEFLKSPKFRGNVGEQILRDLLEEILPKENFSLSYQFREGQMVDAIIKTRQGLIPIDSKFPMESFRKFHQAREEEKERLKKEFIRDIKKHIEDISKKYILPHEGTVDFALMYIPSESIFYEITINQQDLIDYGRKKRVYFVSPNSFYYFLHTIMMALEGAKIEEASRKILDSLRGIRQETLKFEEELNVLVSHINKTKSASERVMSKFSKLASKIENLGALKEKEEPKKLENGEG